MSLFLLKLLPLSSTSLHFLPSQPPHPLSSSSSSSPPLHFHEENQLMTPLSFISLLLLLSLTTAQHITNNSSAIDILIRNHAFLPLPLHRTGHPYHLHLPSNLSSITAIAVRLRGADLWLRGSNLGSFHLPPGIFTGPYARRTLLVFHDLGSLSSSYFAVPGHVLIAPVVSCLAYDASNVSFVRPAGGIRELSLRPTRDPITIVFPAVAVLPGTARCVRFGPVFIQASSFEPK